MVEFRNVDFAYRKKTVFSNLSFTVPKGNLALLSGESGCGKSTVLRLILGLEKPKKGSVSVPDGTRFSVVFQENRLIPHKTVLENVSLFCNAGEAEAMLCSFSLKEVLHNNIDTLSGGMKRRVAIARALAHPFDILILDEAFTGLDDANIRSAVVLIEKVAHDKTIFLATHHAGEADYFTRERVEIRL